jgi:hypothetical protein
LESVCGGNVTEGSNPSLSAIFFFEVLGRIYGLFVWILGKPYRGFLSVFESERIKLSPEVGKSALTQPVWSLNWIFPDPNKLSFLRHRAFLAWQLFHGCIKMAS